jgi:23S rRNA (cytosine1962-C5)-methyltransferase
LDKIAVSACNLLSVTSVPARVVLKPGRDKSLRHRHPWIFSGAIARIEGEPGMGDTVQVVAADGAFLAWAAYGPASQIRARVWSFDAGETIDEGFLERRIAAALERRRGLEGSDGMRLVHGESDGLPGFVADRYGDTVVVQILSAGAERWREAWPRLLAKVAGAKAVFERSDVEVRTLEGLKPRPGGLLGDV